MSQTIVTYTVKPGRQDENAALVRAVFEELAETRPAGFRYTVVHGIESGEFVHLYTDDGAASGTLQQLPAFQAFVAEAESEGSVAPSVRSRDERRSCMSHQS